MTGPVDLAAWCLVFAGIGAMALSAVAAAALPGVFDRLHLLSVATSVGSPLVGLGLILHRGWGEAAAMVALITVLVVLSAPALSAATARLTAQYAGVVDEDSPP